MSKARDRVLEVPKLDSSGKTGSWKNQLEVSLSALRLIGYLHGMKPLPTDLSMGQSKDGHLQCLLSCRQLLTITKPSRNEMKRTPS